MSKFKTNQFKITAYPTFRLYTAPKTFVEFKEKEPKNEQQEIITKIEILDAPSSKIGDDFDVSW